MKAEHKPNEIVTRKRTPLQDVIPLETPFSIFIEPASACNFKCKFCLHGDDAAIRESGFTPGIMKFDLFKKLVDELHLFPEKIKTVHLCFRGEPLLNKRLPDMIRYLKQSGLVNEVTTTTNAALLTTELSDELVDAGLDVIKFSIEALSREGYMELAGADIEFDKLVENIRYFYRNKKNTQVYTKIVDCGLTESEKNQFYEAFESCSDEVFIETVADLWNGAGSDFIAQHSKEHDLYGRPLNLAQCCPKIFYSASVCCDGEVIPCGADWTIKVPLGNTAETPLYNIWNGDKLNTLRKAHLRFMKDKLDLCRGCNVLKVCIPDNIDDYAGEILEKWNNGIK